MEVTIRLASEQDLEVLADMRFDFTAEDKQIDQSDEAKTTFREKFAAQCSSYFTNQRWFIWVAEVNGEIVSHIYLQRIDKVLRPERQPQDFYWMTNVYTKPAFRSKGIGSQLLGAVNTWLDEQDAEFALVWPSDEGRIFYERNGYKTLNDPMARTKKEQI
ncbi:GNAT family N-acetyltransferase [Chryseomicrobium sp. FSL W7-1435]|uniref:GNAT family N-acetyltransferase n=1 Tax=Chryseomicrobium sp. FSL W7-1435 TaxID=2921704 RepID=UPI00315B33F7